MNQPAARRTPPGFITLTKPHSLKPCDVAIDKIAAYGQGYCQSERTWIILGRRKRLLWVNESINEVRDAISQELAELQGLSV